MSLKHFLLVFDHEQGHLLEEREFGSDINAAVKAYDEAERQNAPESGIEIVLIGSDSLDTVRLTHANYFDGSVAVSKYLTGL